MKKVLGLDLGTNSIGWAVVNVDDNSTPCGISAAGSRIIPMGEDALSNFNSGKTSKNSTIKSPAAQRTDYRGVRRLRERNLLRRERLLKTLKIMGFLPEHFAKQISDNGKFVNDDEPKIAWKKNDDGKYEFVFKSSFAEMLQDFKGKKIPYDWTIYYLRKKALTQKITKEELAWILLQFNQKRGYYQLRGEDEEEGKSVQKIRQYFDRQVIVDIVDTGQVYKGLKVLNIVLENGDTGKMFKKEIPAWKGLEKNIIATVDIDKNGNDKYDEDGNLSRRFKIPTEEEWDSEWKLIKMKTEDDLNKSQKTVGCYIYDALLQNPNQKITGKLVRTVERKYYKEELKQILEFQSKLIPELADADLYNKCICELYKTNVNYRKSIANKGFVYLLKDDILFYQRPLKSKKSLISNCPYESHKDKDGNKHPVKCIAKSNPLFQEFRLWQFVQNLRIYQRERKTSDGQMNLFSNKTETKLQMDVDVTAEILKSEDDYVNLFKWLNNRANIKQDTLLNSYFKCKKEKGKDHYPYRWNYVEDKEYPCNATRAIILGGLDKCGINNDFLTKEREMELWHLLYSVNDKSEILKALTKYADKNKLPETFAETFANIKPFEKDYGSYSEKAIKKLLPLMRIGEYWNYDNIDSDTKNRIEKIISGEYDDNIKNRVRDKAINLKDENDFRGLPIWLACYIVYDRHSEAKEINKWKSPEDIDAFLKNDFKQHSLHNPVVEQVITETLRTVRDIWKQEGNIDEIHLELGREMKNPADKREKMTKQIQENENTNLRIKALLMEFMNPEMGIENVRPYSPSQQDILRIYEENALDNLSDKDKDFDFVSKMAKTAQPSKTDITRYKLWLEQKYRSPYTGETINLSRLFTSDYQIEHVIPQSRYFDDSFSNKVICEAEVNQLKDKEFGYEFIKQHQGEKVQISQGKTVTIFSLTQYEDFVKEHYAHNRTKMKKLLMDDIPDGFIERQLNDSRYISKYIKALLSNIVREKISDSEYEQEAVSKNLITCNGAITDRLKKDWGMNDVWNSIILPRFRRMNELMGKDCFTTTSAEGHEIPAMPFEWQKGFNKKRIDHRHHAMDAIVIACATRDHVNLLNNEAAHSKHNANRYQLQRKLRRYEKTIIKGEEREIAKEFLKPWDTFTSDAKQALQNIIVSFKQNLRVINNTVNHYQKFDKDGKKKEFVKQEKGDSLAIRKSMHKETVFGEVNLKMQKDVSLQNALKCPDMIIDKELKQKIKELLSAGKDFKQIKKYFDEEKEAWSEVKTGKIKVYYFTKDTNDRYFATRKPLDTSFNAKKIEESITDTAIHKILMAHLEAKGGDPELAFSPDGIDEMNRNIVALNDGLFHQPIYKVRVYEKAEKFAVGQKGNKKNKFVEADKGTNLFFAVFETIIQSKKKRTFLTIPLNVMINCQKQFANDWRNHIEDNLKKMKLVSEDCRLIFILSPNDLVYLPSNDSTEIDKSRIYKIVSFTGNRLYAISNPVSKSIVDKMEYTQLNKLEFTDDKVSIKEICVPLSVDRLGNIIKVGF